MNEQSVIIPHQSGDQNTYRTVAQDIEASQKPFSQDDWRKYYTPQQMTGGERVPIFNQIPQAPLLTNNLGGSLYGSMYKFNGVPAISEVKSDTTTIGSNSTGSPQIRSIAGRPKTVKKRTRRAIKPGRRTAKRRSEGSKKSSAKATGSKKAKGLLRGISKMPPALAKYWAKKRKQKR